MESGVHSFQYFGVKKADTKVRLSRRYLVLLWGADKEDVPGPPAKLGVVSVFHLSAIAKTIAVSISGVDGVGVGQGIAFVDSLVAQVTVWPLMVS